MIRLMKLAAIAALAALPMTAQAADRASLFGIELGASLPMPECKVFGNADMCWRNSAIRDGRQERTVQFGPEHSPTAAPTWIKGGIRVTMDANDTVAGIDIITWGAARQQQILTALTEKFGTPTNSKIRTKQNGFGASFDALQADWLTADGDFISLEGIGSRMDSGFITAMTAAYLKQFMSEHANSGAKL